MTADELIAAPAVVPARRCRRATARPCARRPTATCAGPARTVGGMTLLAPAPAPPRSRSPARRPGPSGRRVVDADPTSLADQSPAWIDVADGHRPLRPTPAACTSWTTAAASSCPWPAAGGPLRAVRRRGLAPRRLGHRRPGRRPTGTQAAVALVLDDLGRPPGGLHPDPARPPRRRALGPGRCPPGTVTRPRHAHVLDLRGGLDAVRGRPPHARPAAASARPRRPASTSPPATRAPRRLLPALRALARRGGPSAAGSPWPWPAGGAGGGTPWPSSTTMAERLGDRLPAVAGLAGRRADRRVDRPAGQHRPRAPGAPWTGTGPGRPGP